MADSPHSVVFEHMARFHCDWYQLITPSAIHRGLGIVFDPFLSLCLTSFLPTHHAVIHHAVTHDQSIYVYGTILCFNIFVSSWTMFRISSFVSTGRYPPNLFSPSFSRSTFQKLPVYFYLPALISGVPRILEWEGSRNHRRRGGEAWGGAWGGIPSTRGRVWGGVSPPQKSFRILVENTIF